MILLVIETETQRGKGTCPGSHSRPVAAGTSEASFSDSESMHPSLSDILSAFVLLHLSLCLVECMKKLTFYPGSERSSLLLPSLGFLQGWFYALSY